MSKKYLTSLILLGFLMASSDLYANPIVVDSSVTDPSVQSQPVAPTRTGYARETKVENLLSWEYPKLVLDDTWHVFSSPTRWNQQDWILAGVSTGAVIAVGAYVDQPVEKEFIKKRNKDKDNFSKAVQPFGAEYSFAVLGAFEIGGLAFHDNRAKEVAQDGLAASIIAAGIIAPSLQYATGRSRPSQDGGPGHYNPFGGNHSFPSGHTTQAFAVATAVADHYDSLWVKVGSYGLASAVGYARMERKAHWASDVLAGALIGTFVGRAVVNFNRHQRFEISPMIDTDTVGAEVTHSF